MAGQGRWSGNASLNGAVLPLLGACVLVVGCTAGGSGEQRKETLEMAPQATQYGFRHDPMDFVENGRSVPAALVREQVFATPQPGDGEIIEKHVAEILAKQRPDGSFGDKADDTGRSLDWLAAAGVRADRAEFKRGFEAMMRQRQDEATAGKGNDYGQEGLVLVPVNGLRAACMTDFRRTPQVRATLRWLNAHPDVWLDNTCPWGAMFVLKSLWLGRDVEDTGPGIRAALAWIAQNMNDSGCVRYWDPYAVAGAVGLIDMPEARTVLKRQVPMLLRGQWDDGSWGDNRWDLQTLDVFRALKNHGLLDKLRALPPLPADWRVVRSIPAPEGDLGWMTWQFGRLWMLVWGNGEILGISPEDGAVVKRLRIPDVFPAGLGQWDGALAVTEGRPKKRVLKVAPDTGTVEAEFPIPFAADPMCATMVNGKLWVADGWLFPGWIVDPARPDRVPKGSPDGGLDQSFRLEPYLAGTCPNGFAVMGDGVWHTDYFARTMIKSGPDGRLTEWAGRPFGGWPPDIAWDGRNLWALDAPNRRICIIRKTATAPVVTRPQPGAPGAALPGRVPADAAAATPVMPDYSSLSLKGNGHVQDSFTLAIQAVARMFGRETDYGDVCALSSNCFSPAVDLGEDCTAWWHLQGWLGDEAMETVASGVGLRAERLDIPPCQGSPDKADEVLAYQKACAATIRAAMSRGAVVLSAGGWRVFVDEGFAPWCWWGVITRAEEDGRRFGACLAADPGRANGYVDRPVDYATDCWALYPGPRTLVEEEAPQEALRNAVARIRGRGPFASDQSHAFGLAAMDAWIAKMEQLPFCGPCFKSAPDRVWSCALNNGQTTTAGAAAAAAWLRRNAGQLAPDARPHMERAAAHYDRIVALLAPAMDWNGPGHYCHFIGDLDKQKAHADVLRQVKAELAAAADEMEAALAAEGVGAPAAAVGAAPAEPGTRKEEIVKQSRKLLESLKARPRWVTHMGAIGGCLDYLGMEVTDGWLYGATGYAFALNIHCQLCPSAPYTWEGDDQVRLGQNAGYTQQTVSNESKDDFAEKQRLAWDMVRKALDEGTPCLAYDLEFGEWYVVHGYDQTGYYYRAIPSLETDGPLAWDKLGTTGRVGGVAVTAVRLTKPASDRQTVMDALRFAVEMQRKGAATAPDAAYMPGVAGYDWWIAALQREDTNPIGASFNAQFWAECRRMAVEFLKEAKGRLNDPGLAPLFDEAIGHYTTVAGKLSSVAELFPMDGQWAARLKDKALCARAIEALKEARAAEAKGLLVLARITGGDLDPAHLSERTPVAPAQPADKPAPRRAVLEGVPKVAYHTDRWKFTPFINSLDCCLRYVGEPEQYDYLMCTSGAAFRMKWAPKAWDGGNSDILGMAVETLEPMRCAFWSAGYEMVPVAKADPAGWPEDILRDSAQRLGGRLTEEAGFRAAIIESINAGRPVIAFGVIGPPEACVITGYDEGGDVLTGWNVFQDDEGAETEPSGYFRVGDWYGKTHALLLIGERAGKPDPKELDRETLKRALQVLRTPRVRNADAGPAAFDSWAADMLNDEYFPEGNIGVLRARLMCHWDSMTVTAFRGGGEATAYLLAAAEREPAMAEHLRAAADCFDHEDVVHGVAPGEEAQMARLADPAVRRQVADSILRARDMHVEAADHIEAALRAAGVPPEDIPQPKAAPDEAAAARPGRMVLEGVPKVGFGVVDGNVEMTPFPACLRACLEYMGDDLGFGDGGRYPRDAVYAYLMGTTGAAFRLSWKPGWHGDNVASWLVSNDPSEIFRRGFAAAGYEQIPSGHLPDAEKEERFRSMVMQSIRDRGLPVIAHGVIGPPEEAIVAGYDEGGRVAIGWSFFQDRAIGRPGVEFEPSGYFRKRHWEADTWSLIVIGDKVGMPERREAYIDALQWALRVVREPVRYGERHNGLAAYDAWAEHILKDDEVAAGGGPDDAFIVHSDAVDVVAEGRYYASVFLRQAADVLPEAKDELLAAAECCKAEHDLMWRIWGEVGSNVPSEGTRREFLRPDVRRRIVPIVRQARDNDAEAAHHIEKALIAAGVELPATAGGDR